MKGEPVASVKTSAPLPSRTSTLPGEPSSRTATPWKLLKKPAAIANGEPEPDSDATSVGVWKVPSPLPSKT